MATPTSPSSLPAIRPSVFPTPPSSSSRPVPQHPRGDPHLYRAGRRQCVARLRRPVRGRRVCDRAGERSMPSAPAGSLDALKGMRIRANNPTQGAALTSLGMVPVQMPINKAAGAIGSGQDRRRAWSGRRRWSSSASRGSLANHYMLGVSSAPLAVVMKPQELRRPARARPGASSASSAASGPPSAISRPIWRKTKPALRTLEIDPDRKVVIPSAVRSRARPRRIHGRDRASGRPIRGIANCWRRRRPSSKGSRRNHGPAMKLLANMSLRRGIVILAIALGILVGGIWAAVKVTTDHLLYRDATATARNWARPAWRKP